MTERILVASDGRPGALGAVRVAREIAEAENAVVEVVAVYEPVDLYAAGSPSEVATLPAHYVPAAVEAVRARVMAQLATVGGDAAGWPVAVEMGRVAGTLARVARERGATLVLAGLRNPGGMERWLSRETLLRLIHLSSAPVVAVPEGMMHRPRKAVVAVDFSPFSLRAARETAAKLPPGGELHLAHVTWPKTGMEGWSESMEWVKSYRSGVEQRMRELAAELRPLGGAAVGIHVLEGDPGKEILRLGEQLGADLLATGSHGSGFFGRLILGSVSKSLVHRSECAVLVAPPETASPEVRAADEEQLRQARILDLLPEPPA